MLSASVLAVFLAVALAGASDHVSFLVLGKTTNHRQTETGDLRLLNYHFFAEVFVREGGRVTKASLLHPGGQRQDFEARGPVLELHGGRFDREEDLDRAHPDGDYVLDLETPAGPVVGRHLSIRASRIPEPPRINLKQGGKPVSPLAIDPSLDLVISWSEFEGAGSDANGVLDDLIFVVVGDCEGRRTVHSGRPFEGSPFLTYRAADYTIPREKLTPGEPHQMFVEHARVDTSVEQGIGGLVTYASTTFLDFRVMGESSGRTCPALMPRMDGGQTDRPAAVER